MSAVASHSPALLVPTLAIGLGCDRGTPLATVQQCLQQALALAGGTPASVAGLPTSDMYCAMLQVSDAAGSVGVATGGAGSVVDGAAAVGSTGVAGVGSVDGEHAISASPATQAMIMCFMRGRVDRAQAASSEPSVSLRRYARPAARSAERGELAHAHSWAKFPFPLEHLCLHKQRGRPARRIQPTALRSCRSTLGSRQAFRG